MIFGSAAMLLHPFASCNRMTGWAGTLQLRTFVNIAKQLKASFSVSPKKPCIWRCNANEPTALLHRIINYRFLLFFFPLLTCLILIWLDGFTNWWFSSRKNVITGGAMNLSLESILLNRRHAFLP